MKELSVEEKAKRYDEAFEMAKMFVKRWECVCATDSEVALKELKAIFPEFAESEDQRIRKDIILAIYDAFVKSERRDKWIAWLEKQGEQKPADKVEPKFHKGDWLIYENGSIYYVNKVYEHTYELVIDNGDKPRIPHELIDKKARLWTIQDAKDGDVLHSLYHRLIWIYKDNEHYHFCVKMNYVTENTATNGQIIIPNDTCPATNDERTILFNNIEKTGYKRNDSKKKLDEIEQKPAWSEEDDNCLSIIIAEFSKCAGKSVSKDEWMRCNDWLNSLRDRVQPKQEWSEEDNKKAERIIRLLQEGYDENCIKSSIDWLINRSKSLRPQNTIVTDEELAQAKKDAYNDALDKIEYYSGEPTFDDGWSAAIWYLKKRNAQPQNRWKPSEEQMKALKEACDEHWEPDGLDPLYTLYQDLKKLR